jgi:hypothetical protein
MITIDDGDKEEKYHTDGLLEHSIFGYPVQRTGTFASSKKKAQSLYTPDHRGFSRTVVNP